MNELGDMSIEDFRQAAVRAVDWIAHYLTHPEEYPVAAPVAPAELTAQLPTSAPETGASIEAIMDDFERLIVPGITHWNHPSFFAYFGITGSAPGILGELLSAALNVNAMLWHTSPSATELEEVATDWLRQLLGLPAAYEGVIMDTASVSTLCAIAAARHALDDLAIRRRGMAGRTDLPQLCLYTSEQSHSSVEKAAIVLGLGTEGVRKIPTDEAYRMDVEALAKAIAEDRAADRRPFCAVATVGTTSTTSIDPVRQIADVCKQEGLWLHVDAAYAGAAAIVPEHRAVLDGCDAADSIVVNPHKWLFTPIDCSVLYTNRSGTLIDAFSLVPEYLKPSGGAGVRNYMDWGVSLGRRFRALKLWMVLRTFGAQGIAARLREHIRLGQMLADWIDQHPEFERLAPTPLSVVCFRARPQALATAAASDESALNEFNEALLERLNASGALYLSHTNLRGRYTLRLAIGNLRTTEGHVRRAWERIQEESAALAGSGTPGR